MKKYLVLYKSPVSAGELMGKSSMEQMKAGMDEWTKWKDKVGDAFVDWGMPLGAAKHVDSSGKASDSHLQVTGYGLIQAESLEAAAELVKDHPHFKRGKDVSIEVLEFMPMPGM